MKHRSILRNCLVVCVGLTTWCYGQSSPPAPEMIHVTAFKIRPDSMLEWESLAKEAISAFKKAGVPWLAMWQTAMFGESRYFAVTPIEKFSEYDGPHPFVRALGEAGAMRIFTTAGRYFAEPPHGYALRFREDLSIRKASSEPPGIAIVTTIRVAPGREQEFTGLLKGEVLPGMQKAEVENFWVYQTVFGGDVNEWTTIVTRKKFADLDAGLPLVRVLGQDGMNRLAAKSHGVVVSMERAVARYRPELGYASQQ